MHHFSTLLCILLCAACQAATAPVAGVGEVDLEIPSAALEQARGRRVLLISGDDRTPLASGLRRLAKVDPRFAIAVGSPWSPPRQGGVVMVRRAETGVRADRAVEALAASASRQAGSFDLAVLDLSSASLPDGNRIAAPVRFFTATMEINMTSANMVGSMVENIGGMQMAGGTLPIPANYPIELPNLGVQHLHTQAAVPAGSSPDDGGWRLSPRDPRQVLGDVVGGLEALKGVQPVYATLPLERSGNAQRNWYNQALRAWCTKVHCVASSRGAADAAPAQRADAPRVEAT